MRRAAPRIARRLLGIATSPDAVSFGVARIVELAAIERVAGVLQELLGCNGLAGLEAVDNLRVVPEVLAPER